MKWWTRGLSWALTALLILLVSCGGNAGTIAPATDVAAGGVPVIGVEQPAGPPGRDLSGFAVVPIQGGAQPELALTCERQGNQLTVSVAAAAPQVLGELLCELRYDPGRYTPLAAQATDAIAPLNESLCLEVLDTPGLVSLGQVALGGGSRQVAEGDVLAEVLFACEALDEPTASRAVSQAPAHAKALSPLLWDSLGGELTWYLVNPGDFNQDGLVGVSDLSPLGREFGQSGPFPFDTARSVIDGNSDGLIGIGDLALIGQYWDCHVEGYNLYASDDIAQVPLSFAEPSSIEPLISFSLDQAQGDPLLDRLWFSYTPEPGADELLYWVRPYAGESEGTRSNVNGPGVESAATEPGGDGFNLPPTARLSLSYEGQSIPLAVSFDASDSDDPDGQIIFYEWDYQGDGLYDAFSTTPLAEYTYIQPGTYAPLVRVTDSGGLWDTFQSPPFEVTEIGVSNIPPVADLMATSTSGGVPLTVGLIATGSFDPDGDIVKYEWDFDGDGEYDLDSGADPTVLHTYSSPGTFTAAVVITDERGGTDEDALEIEVVPVNQFPRATLVIGEGEEFGHAPHTVHFDASSSSDSDDGIAHYWWDLDGDGSYEQMTSVDTFTQVYTTSGEHLATVRVEDHFGLSATAAAPSISVNMPPTAVLSASSTSGRPTLRVGFDASESTDSDGEIVDYEWDFDGNGAFNEEGFEADARGESTAECLFDELGAFNSRLRVTDDDGGQAEATLVMWLWQVGMAHDYYSTLTFSWNDVDADEYKVYRSTIPHDPAPFHVGTVSGTSAELSFSETIPEDDEGRWVPLLNDNGTPDTPADDFPSIAPLVDYYYKVAPVVDGVEYPMSPETYRKLWWGSRWDGVRAWPDTTNQTRSFAINLRPDLMTEAQIEWMADNYVGALDITQTAADRIRAYNPDFIALGEQWASYASPSMHGGYYAIDEFVYGDVVDPAGFWPYINRHESWFVHADGSDVYHQRSLVFPPSYALELYWLDVDGLHKKYLGANMLQFLGEDHFDGWLLGNAEPFSIWNPVFGDWETNAQFYDYWRPKTLSMLEYVGAKCADHDRSPLVIAGVWDWWLYDEGEMDYSPCDGVFVEEFLMRWSQDWATGSLRFPTVMNNALEAQHDGKALILNSNLPAWGWVSDTMTILACYLLLRDEHTYLYYPGTSGENNAYPLWYPECGVDTGAPLDPLAVTVDDYLTTDAFGTPYYRRDFENCSAIVTLSGSPELLFDAFSYNVDRVLVHDGGLVDADGTAAGYWEWVPQEPLGGLYRFPPGGYVVRGLPTD